MPGKVKTVNRDKTQTDQFHKVRVFHENLSTTGVNQLPSPFIYYPKIPDATFQAHIFALY